MNSVLNVKVSKFNHYEAAAKPETVNLLDWLTSEKHRIEIEQLRVITDKPTRDKIKATLPAITPSCTCFYRNENSVIQHSGLIQFDIDFKDNQHISNYSKLREQLCKIKNVAYCGLSASGNGYWGLIPILYSDKHKAHFAIINKLFTGWGIKVDQAPKNIVSLRGYSFDKDAHFNHNAVPLKKYYVPPPPPKTTFNPNPTGDQAKVEACLSAIEAQKIDLTESYSEWYAIGCSLAGAFGEGGREYYHQVSQFHPAYMPTETEKQFTHCLKSGSGSIAVFLDRCKAAGIRYKENTVYKPILQKQVKPEPHRPKYIYSKNRILEAVAAAMKPGEEYSSLPEIWQELLRMGAARPISESSHLYYFNKN